MNTWRGDSLARDRLRSFWIGLLAMSVVVVFVLGVTQAERVREWLDPSRSLRLVLPDDGLYGLSEGANVEILGTRAGRVTAIVIRPDTRIHAEALIDPDLAIFVRRDSTAIIRKTFGVAGDAYVEITRGRGEPMDWDYAVIEAAPDRAPTDNIADMLEEIRSRVIPILDQTERTMTALADLSERFAAPEGSLQTALGDVSRLTTRIERGEGSLGRLLSNDATAREVEQLLANANATVAGLPPILAELQTTAAEAASMSRAVNARSGDLPALSARIASILDSLDSVLRDLSQTSPELPGITRDVAVATAGVPVMLGMTQQTLAELETLLRQLRGSWLLGGGGAQAPADARLSPREVRP
jgi:phospholipid/cholesterol/gamma-HCH transport system substrate-binding protein